MTAQARTAQTFRAVRAHYLVAAGGSALALAALVAAGGALLGGNGSSSVSTSRPSFSRSLAMSEPSITYYLVATEAQAAAVLQAEDDAARVRVASGDLGRGDSVFVVVASDEAIARTESAIMGGNAIRGSLGLPEMRLVDLRR